MGIVDGAGRGGAGTGLHVHEGVRAQRLLPSARAGLLRVQHADVMPPHVPRQVRVGVKRGGARHRTPEVYHRRGADHLAVHVHQLPCFRGCHASGFWFWWRSGRAQCPSVLQPLLALLALTRANVEFLRPCSQAGGGEGGMQYSARVGLLAAPRKGNSLRARGTEAVGTGWSTSTEEEERCVCGSERCFPFHGFP